MSDPSGNRGIDATKGEVGIESRDEPSGPSPSLDVSDDGRGVSRRRPRLPEFDYLGHQAYHVTVVTHRRMPILSENLAESVCTRIVQSAAATNFDPLAYCVMPDHCHLLLQGCADDSSLLKFMKLFKQTTSFIAQRDFGHHLWQQSFHDRVLRKDDDALHVARYIIENPVAAGLTSDSSTWPHTGGTIVAQSQRIEWDGPEGSSLLFEP